MSYEKQTWNKYDDLKTEKENIVNGAVVTDNRMNHIEEGIYSHTIDISNPHKVTAAQVGLGNIQNFGLATEDEAKQAISNAKYMTPSLTQAVLSANINSIAYANSADGTDGFTTVYPNLNLLVNSSAKTKDGFFKDFGKVENGYGEVTLEGTNGWDGRSLFDGFSIYPRDYKPGDKYTMSMDIMFTSWNFPAGTYLDEFWMGQRYTYGGGIWSWKPICTINLPRDPSKMLNQWIRITQTSTIPPYEDPAVNTETILSTIFRGPSKASFTMRVRKPKQEPGSIATPHMPSATEVTTADWPKYVGFSNTVKTNKSASDYTWFPVKDSELTNKVESHINNKANPHAVTASQVGAYSKSESDSKLTALENKSISNKGNLKKGDDLNDITATGFYRIGGFVGGTEILNVPTELSGVKFYAFVTVTEAIQELTVYAPINSTTWTYSRSISGTKPTWSSWSKTVMADDSGKVKLTDFEVTTISETVNIGNGLSLNFQRKGEFVLVRFSGSLTAINSGTYFSTAVPEQWRPDGIKELIGHFASGALAFHVDLETDGRVKWWGASGATGAPRGTAMYFLK